MTAETTTEPIIDPDLPIIDAVARQVFDPHIVGDVNGSQIKVAKVFKAFDLRG